MANCETIAGGNIHIICTTTNDINAIGASCRRLGLNFVFNPLTNTHSVLCTQRAFNTLCEYVERNYYGIKFIWTDLQPTPQMTMGGRTEGNQAIWATAGNEAMLNWAVPTPHQHMKQKSKQKRQEPQISSIMEKTLRKLSPLSVKRIKKICQLNSTE